MCWPLVVIPGNSEQTIMVAAPLVPVLIDCWADCAPTVCGVPIPDVVNLSSMVSITEALSLLFHCFILESSTDPSWRTMGIKFRFSSFDNEQEHWEMRGWMRREFLPALQKHVLAVFPLVAPAVRLPAKVQIGTWSQLANIVENWWVDWKSCSWSRATYSMWTCWYCLQKVSARC